MDAAGIWHVATLQDYNTRLVVSSTILLGIAAGLVGSFLLMRKRSLMADSLSHATLPGIAMAFLVAVGLGGTGKVLPVLLAGAVITGVIGFLSVQAIRNLTRTKDDAAMGIVLSVFFGAGVVLLGIVQALPGASAAGLESFIYGKTASMVAADFQILAGVAVAAAVLSILVFKELRLLCFDQNFAAAQGWPVHLLDFLLLGLVTAVAVAGLQAVGLILIIAFLIIPPAAARFWTERLDRMLVISAWIGALSGWLGASVSALLPKMPAGAVIVLVAAALFLLSLLFGTRRGVLVRWMAHHRLHRRVGRQHLLRAAFEVLEDCGGPDAGIPENRPVETRQLLAKRSWSKRELHRFIRGALEDDLIRNFDNEAFQLTAAGFREAARIARNHRLWEIYLIEFADVAPSMVDRDADAVEHVLGEDMVKRLEELLFDIPPRTAGPLVPASPHPIASILSA